MPFSIWHVNMPMGEERVNLPNHPKAFQLFNQAMIHEPQNGSIYNNLGMFYERGLGCPRNLKKAIKMYQKAIKLECITACANLAHLYLAGGDHRPLLNAIDLYRRAMEKGHASAFNDMGYIYEFGLGLPKNIQKAIEYYQKAIDRGYADALANLAELYESGTEVPQDHHKAFELYQNASQHGCQWAYRYLGVLYEGGYGCHKDLERARMLSPLITR